ncbi:hypothetical protein [Bacillus sp. Marseille-Q3570]|uniref:hypothetical protein n=1 Tax=Bacillus sp. Marseille-Q3570 TaxID=2963522 RepID=UPI0021B7C9E0|nr:hypothetical protein [Bacillus sp. Marseille-Q3570]
MLANRDIRETMKHKGIFHWQVAYELGLNDGNFSRLLRKELNDKKKEQILKAIKKIQKKGVDENGETNINSQTSG